MTTWRQWLERNPAGRGEIYQYEWAIDLDKPWKASQPSASVQSGPDLSNSSGWLTAEEAAAYLKIEPATLLMLARQGKVRGYVLSGSHRRTWRFLRVDLDAKLLASSAALDEKGRTQ